MIMALFFTMSARLLCFPYGTFYQHLLRLHCLFSIKWKKKITLGTEMVNLDIVGLARNFFGAPNFAHQSLFLAKCMHMHSLMGIVCWCVCGMLI